MPVFWGGAKEVVVSSSASVHRWQRKQNSDASRFLSLLTPPGHHDLISLSQAALYECLLRKGSWPLLVHSVHCSRALLWAKRELLWMRCFTILWEFPGCKETLGHACYVSSLGRDQGNNARFLTRCICDRVWYHQQNLPKEVNFCQSSSSYWEAMSRSRYTLRCLGVKLYHAKFTHSDALASNPFHCTVVPLTLNKVNLSVSSFLFGKFGEKIIPVVRKNNWKSP